MIKKSLHLFFFLFIFLSSTQNGIAQKNKLHFIVGTGSRGGNYYKTGAYIVKQYTHYLPDYQFTSIETNGSNENIKLIKNNSIDFAIVQRNILINSLYDEENGVKNLAVITPLFQEKLWMYFQGNKPLTINKIDSLSATKKLIIGVTSKEGYSYKIFSTLTKFLNINLANTQTIEKNYDSLVKDFSQNKIDLIVSFSLPLKNVESLNDVQYLYLNAEDAKLIEKRIHNVHATHIHNNEQQYSLGSWSFLIGARNSIQFVKPEKKLVSALLEKPVDSNDLYINQLISHSFNQYKKNKHKEILQLRNLPLSATLHSIAGLKVVNWGFYLRLLLVPLILMLVYYYYRGKFFPKINLLFFWHRYKHFQFGFILLIIIYFSSIELLVYAEKVFYEDIGIKSQILNMTRRDLHSWLLVTTVTGNSNGIFPLSLLGKAMLALNSLNFWIGTILIGVSEYVTYKMNKKRKNGLMETKYHDHLVIFGWNITTEKFILETIHEAKDFLNKNIHIVCVVPDIEDVRKNYKSIKELHDKKKIDIIEGDALKTSILELAKVEFADTIILLSEDRSKLSDEHVALRAHAISRYVKLKKEEGKLYETTLVEKVSNKVKSIFSSKKQTTTGDYKRYKIKDTSDKAYMIAEINNNDFKESLIDAGVNEIVVAGNYRKAIMKQSLFNHGISKVIDEIMQYNEHNEFYKIDLSKPENAHLVGKTFDELLIALRKQGILLIGVHIVFHDEYDNIIIDQKAIQQLLQEEEENITRDVIVNPTDPTERNRPVDGDDHLIVLATNMKTVTEGVKKVKF